MSVYEKGPIDDKAGARTSTGSHCHEPLPERMTAAEVEKSIRQSVDQIQSDIQTYDERAAIQQASAEARTRGKTTIDFAIQALQRQERFAGEHDVARAWIRNYEPHVRVFVRVTE